MRAHWKAQHRLHQRYVRLTARGKSKQHAVTAVARELLGYTKDLKHAASSNRRGDSTIQEPMVSGWDGTRQRRILVGCYARQAFRRRTRASSPRPLPTNHDCDGEAWASIHEYQSDRKHSRNPVG